MTEIKTRCLAAALAGEAIKTPIPCWIMLLTRRDGCRVIVEDRHRWRYVMRFGPFGSFVQLHPRSEGYLLWWAGLLLTDGFKDAAEYHPSRLLRSMFPVMPEMEELYPVLVEFVLIFRYMDIPAFVDAEATTRRLIELGITSDGLTTLSKLVAYTAQRI